MTLIGADERLVVTERIALLLVRANYFFQHIHIERTAFRYTGDKLIHIRPAVFVQRNANHFGMMAQYQRNKLARFGKSHMHTVLYTFVRHARSIHGSLIIAPYSRAVYLAPCLIDTP